MSYSVVITDTSDNPIESMEVAITAEGITSISTVRIYGTTTATTETAYLGVECARRTVNEAAVTDAVGYDVVDQRVIEASDDSGSTWTPLGGHAAGTSPDLLAISSLPDATTPLVIMLRANVPSGFTFGRFTVQPVVTVIE